MPGLGVGRAARRDREAARAAALEEDGRAGAGPVGLRRGREDERARCRRRAAVDLDRDRLDRRDVVEVVDGDPLDRPRRRELEGRGGRIDGGRGAARRRVGAVGRVRDALDARARAVVAVDVDVDRHRVRPAAGARVAVAGDRARRRGGVGVRVEARGRARQARAVLCGDASPCRCPRRRRSCRRRSCSTSRCRARP